MKEEVGHLKANINQNYGFFVAICSLFSHFDFFCSNHRGTSSSPRVWHMENLSSFTSVYTIGFGNLTHRRSGPFSNDQNLFTPLNSGKWICN